MTHRDSGNMTVLSNSRLIGFVLVSLTMAGSIGLASEAKEHVLERPKPLAEVVDLDFEGNWSKSGVL